MIQHVSAGTRFGFTGVAGGSATTFRVLSNLTLWEWAGSFRYNLSTGGLQPFMKLGFGLSWYRLEGSAIQVNEDAPVPMQNSTSPWVRKPGGSFSSFLPNTWHGGVGLEWIPIVSHAPLPRGIDVGVRADFTVYTHELGFNDIRSPLFNPPPGETFENRIWRPVFDLALTLSF